MSGAPPSWAGRRALLVLMLSLAGCKKPGSGSSRVDCQEDLDCYIARARQCFPTTVVHAGLCPLNWAEPVSEVPMTLQYEVHGRVGGRCHVSRIQLHPSWDWPDAGPRPEETWEVLRWEQRREMPFSNALGIHAPLMQCLYAVGQHPVGEALRECMRRGWQGGSRLRIFLARAPPRQASS